MAQQKESAPSGMAGLVRYEEEKSRVNIKPEYVFAGIAAIAEVELVFQGLLWIAAAFGAMFGLMFYWMYGKGFPKQQGRIKEVSIQQQPSQPAQQEQQVQQDVAQQ